MWFYTKELGVDAVHEARHRLQPAPDVQGPDERREEFMLAVFVQQAGFPRCWPRSMSTVCSSTSKDAEHKSDRRASATSLPTPRRRVRRRDRRAHRPGKAARGASRRRSTRPRSARPLQERPPRRRRSRSPILKNRYCRPMTTKLSQDPQTLQGHDGPGPEAAQLLAQLPRHHRRRAQLRHARTTRYLRTSSPAAPATVAQGLTRTSQGSSQGSSRGDRARDRAEDRARG